MAVPHKFYERDFKNGFQTHNAILDTTPNYSPVAMFLGTNNPDTIKNLADFYYGRNYFWPGLTNIFKYGEAKLVKSRMHKNGAPKVLVPAIDEIFDLCIRLKLTFADLIISVFRETDKCKMLDNDNVVFDNKTYNLIQDKGNKDILGLTELDKIGRVKWNTDNIIRYLNENPTIKTVYLTRQPDGIWESHWNKIKLETQMPGRKFIPIYTPSAQGGALHQQTKIYGKGKMIPLLSHWINGPNGRFERDWLIANGAVLENFS